MEKITSENIDMSYPFLIDYDMIKSKKLGEDKPDERYFKLVNKYKRLFEEYIKDMLPLEKIDTNLKNSKLHFNPVKEENMDYYQITSTLGLDYIYVRNNFYIEKLSFDELSLLESFENLNDESKEFIKKTYLNVINPYDDSKVIFYGPENGKHLCKSTDVVLGIRYDEFADNGLNDEEFQSNFLEQLKLISEVETVLEIVGLSKLGSSLMCIHYNEASIMQRYKKAK